MKERLVIVGLGLSLLGYGLKVLVDKQQKAVDTLKDVIVTLKETVPREPAQAPPPVVPEPPKAEPEKVEEPVNKKLLVMHTADWCGYCQRDKREILPRWRADGYNIPTPVDHTDYKNNPSPHPLPWYEITDEKGNKKVWIGSLRNYRK